MLDISKLKAALPDFKVLYFDEIDSTNSEAKRRILAGEKANASISRLIRRPGVEGRAKAFIPRPIPEFT